MTLAIQTHQLSRSFNESRAVDGIDLAVGRGTFYGFLGPNGAGKSTTIKMLTGLLSPTSGRVLVLGRDMLDAAESLEAKRHMGVIPEDLALFDYLTAREYLTFVGRVHLMAKQTIRDRSEELLAVLDLQDEHKKLTLEYSHGMKKKLALAAALLPNPDLLFLDEPFEGVDAVTSRVIRDLARGVCRPGIHRLSHLACPRNRRASLHPCRDHREREVSRAGVPGRDSPGRFAGKSSFLEKVGAHPESTGKLNWLEGASS